MMIRAEGPQWVVRPCQLRCWKVSNLEISVALYSSCSCRCAGILMQNQGWIHEEAVGYNADLAAQFCWRSLGHQRRKQKVFPKGFFFFPKSPFNMAPLSLISAVHSLNTESKGIICLQPLHTVARLGQTWCILR